MKFTQEMFEHAVKGGKFRFWYDDRDSFVVDTLNKLDLSGAHCPFKRTNGDDGCWFKNIEIYKPELYVKDAVSIMKQLIADGYRPDAWGYFNKEGKLSFATYMWQFCGKQQPDRFDWSPEWLEEK